MVRPEDYVYELPESLIAREPAPHRDDSRLFIYDTQKDTIHFDRFFNIHKYLPAHSLLVLNETKVLPSRIVLHKSTGGKVKTLILVNEHIESEREIRMFVDRKVQIGDRLYFNQEEYLTVVAQQEHIFTATYLFPRARLYDLLKEKGTMPIPLYIKGSSLDEENLREKYQTVFAKYEGSSAAPTASLHFTESVFQELEKMGIGRVFVTLHVGLGTFAPVEKHQISEKKLHKEWYEVPPNTLKMIHESKNKGDEIVAVGTTVVRTLESIAKLKETKGNTDLFIYPPYQFRMVDHMITNFHLPGSSLMMLVEAFLQHKHAKRKLTDLYKTAISKRFRFYSFGDSMLIL